MCSVYDLTDNGVSAEIEWMSWNARLRQWWLDFQKGQASAATSDPDRDVVGLEDGEVEPSILSHLRWRNHLLIRGAASVACLDCVRCGATGTASRWIVKSCDGPKGKLPRALRARLLAGEFDRSVLGANARVLERLRCLSCNLLS